MTYQLLPLAGIALLGAISGLMIGCIGIGGVILVPMLVFAGGIPIRVGIPAAMFAYILSGLVATFVFARHKSIDWRMAGLLCLSATPASFAGAWAVSVVNTRLLEAFLGVLTLASGLNALRGTHVAEQETHRVSDAALLTVGGFTGFLSSLSGTGGPLVLVPVLVSMAVPVLTAVGLSQAIQLPIAVAATAGNLLYGEIDWLLGGILAASLTLGAWYGARLAHAVPRVLLRRIVSLALVTIGALILVKLAWPLIFSR